MNSQKKAFTTAAIAIIALAAAMYFFYFVKDRTRKTDSDIDLNQKVEQTVKEEKSEFVGIYSPGDTLEGDGKRIAFFQVNRKEDGGYLGVAKVDTVGSEASAILNCIEVKIEEKEFFLKCIDDKIGNVSLNGQWQKTGNAIQVNGHVLWSKDGNAYVDRTTTFTFQP